MTIAHSIFKYGVRNTKVFNPAGGMTSSTSATNVEISREVNTVPVDTNTKDHTVPHNYQYSVHRHTQLQGMMEIVDNLKWRTVHEGIVPMGSPSVPSYYDLSAGRNFVYNKALAKLHEELRGSIDLSIDIIQYKQTSKMTAKYLTRDGIASLAQSLIKIRRMTPEGFQKLFDLKFHDAARYSDYLKRMSVKKQLQLNTALLRKLKNDENAWKKYFTVPADLWLEWIYGWKPIGNSIYQALDNDATAILGAVKTAFKCRVTIPYPLKDERKYSLNAQYYAEIKGKTSCTISAEVDTVRDPKNIATWTSMNPVSMVYEAIPYSFVVDWFYNISGYLRSLETSLLYNNVIKSVVVSELDVYDAAIDVDVVKHKVGALNYTIQAHSKEHECYFKRTVASTALMPRVPQFRVELGPTRLASAAALLAQLLKR